MKKQAAKGERSDEEGERGEGDERGRGKGEKGGRERREEGGEKKKGVKEAE